MFTPKVGQRGNMDRYLIRRDGNFVVVDLHKWFHSDMDAAGWAAAQIAV